jgi:hypothetical protein
MYCVDLVGGSISQRCVASLAIFTALRFMSFDPGAITMAKCLRWHSPDAAELVFLSDRSTWTDSQSLEFSVLTPFISGCALPQVALTFSSRMLAAACDLQAPAPSAEDASALRLPALVCILTGYATLAHLRAPFDWMQHANGVFVFWGARCGVDPDRVLQALQVMHCQTPTLTVICISLSFHYQSLFMSLLFPYYFSPSFSSTHAFFRI